MEALQFSWDHVKSVSEVKKEWACFDVVSSNLKTWYAFLFNVLSKMSKNILLKNCKVNECLLQTV